MQPAFSSNRLGIETTFLLSDAIDATICLEIMKVVGTSIPDNRFWIPTNTGVGTSSKLLITDQCDCSQTFHLRCNDRNSLRLDLLRKILSLGFHLNAMFIPELRISDSLKVSIACPTEPFNFHPRLLTSNNSIDGCSVTFAAVIGTTDSNTELTIISAICQSCGMSRM